MMRKFCIHLRVLIVILAGGLFGMVWPAAGQTPSAQEGQSENPAPVQPTPPAQPASPPKPAKPQKTSSSHSKINKKKLIPPAKGKADESAEPDKVLYNRAMLDQQKARYTEERLSLQTLINTYPDSEYLAKAKLAIADSYYKEGGNSNLTQSVAEYKDFITFFPFLDEAAYAQMQVAMAHYHMMEKPDRDKSQAEDAEDELQTFLLKYPQSPLAPKAEQRLRDVQEVLAEADYRVADYYFLKGDLRAAGPRLLEVTQRYPLYSQSDKALWMLAAVYEKAEKRESADKVYARIVQDYPISPYVPEAKKKLIAAGVPVPQADRVALARMEKDRELEKRTKTQSLVHMPMGMLSSRPDVTDAAHSGKPNLNPPDDTISAADILKPSAAPTATVTVTASAGGSGAVETVPAGSSMEQVNGSEAGSTPATTIPSQGVPAAQTGGSGISDSSAAGSTDGSTPSAQTGGVDSTPQPETGGVDSTPQPQTGGTSQPPAAASSGNGSSTAPSSAATNGAQGGATSGSNSATTNSTDQNNSSTADPSTESTSKKKKGIKKVIPW